MKAGFDPGLARELTFIVTEDMCPAFDGVVVHRCCSTWSLVHYLELAARRVLLDFLEPHEEGMGTHISVDHLSPCGVGRTIRVRAELTKVARNRAICRVEAFEGSRLLAEGVQVQAVLPAEHIRRLIDRHT